MQVRTKVGTSRDRCEVAGEVGPDAGPDFALHLRGFVALRGRKQFVGEIGVDQRSVLSGHLAVEYDRMRRAGQTGIASLPGFLESQKLARSARYGVLTRDVSPSPAALDVLAVDSDERTLDVVRGVGGSAWFLETATSTAEAERILDSRSVRVLLCADDLEGETGLMFLARTRDRWPMLQRVLLAPDLDGDLLLHAVREVSVFNYLPKPPDPEALKHLVEHALRQNELLANLVRTTTALDRERIANARLSAPASSARRLPHFALLAAAVGIGIFTLAAVLVSLLYFLKALLGIDVFSNQHLTDFLR